MGQVENISRLGQKVGGFAVEFALKKGLETHAGKAVVLMLQQIQPCGQVKATIDTFGDVRRRPMKIHQVFGVGILGLEKELRTTGADDGAEFLHPADPEMVKEFARHLGLTNATGEVSQVLFRRH